MKLCRLRTPIRGCASSEPSVCRGASLMGPCLLCYLSSLWRLIMFLRVNERIEINPRVCGGQPVVIGTRISVAAVLEQLAAGEPWDSLLRAYPELSRADIQPVLEYARHAVLHTEIEA